MQQVSRLGEIDATEQGEVVACLQEPEVLVNPRRSDVVCCKRCIGGQAGSQFRLQFPLPDKESIEQRQLTGLDGAAIRSRRQQVVGVHGDKQSSVGVFLGYHANGALADREVVREIDLLKRGVLANQFDGEGARFSLAGDLRLLIACSPAVVVACDPTQHLGTRLGRKE